MCFGPCSISYRINVYCLKAKDATNSHAWGGCFPARHSNFHVGGVYMYMHERSAVSMTDHLTTDFAYKAGNCLRRSYYSQCFSTYELFFLVEPSTTK